MEHLTAHMGPGPVEFIRNHMNPGADGENPAVYQNPGGQIPQVGAL